MIRAFTHDASGNIIEEVRSGVTWTYSHNAARRLAQTSVDGSVRGTYTYDGLERLAVRVVSNTVPSGTTHLIYDGDGNLLAEADGLTGATVREYVWLPVDDPALPQEDETKSRLGTAERDSDPTSKTQLPSLQQPKQRAGRSFAPLAVASDVTSATPTVLFVHADHLERPVMMTGAAKQVVWAPTTNPLGRLRASPGSPASTRASPASGTNSKAAFIITGTGIMIPPRASTCSRILSASSMDRAYMRTLTEAQLT